MNDLRDPHEPVMPGQHEHPAEGHGGVSMAIGVSGNRTDAHEPVVPEGQLPAAHTEDHPAQAPDASNLVELLSDGLKQANERIAELERELKAAAPTPLDEQLAEQPAPPAIEPAP